MNRTGAAAVGTHATSPVMGVIAVACAYEVVAEVVNEVLDADLLPTLRHRIEAFSWSGVARRLRPAWALPATFVAAGFVLATLNRARSRSAARPAGQPSNR